jgi:hypothetical protein
MTPDDQIELNSAAAKLMALEAVLMQILRPLLERVQPGAAAEVIEAIRVGLNVETQNEVQRLVAQEYLFGFADEIEARLRTRLGLHP